MDEPSRTSSSSYEVIWRPLHISGSKSFRELRRVESYVEADNGAVEQEKIMVEDKASV